MPQRRLLPTIKIADAQLEADCTQKGISTTEVEEEGTLLRPPPPPRGMDSKDWDSQPLPIRKALMACTCTTEVEEEGNLLCPPPPRVARWRLRGRATYYAPAPSMWQGMQGMGLPIAAHTQGLSGQYGLPATPGPLGGGALAPPAATTPTPWSKSNCQSGKVGVHAKLIDALV